jgi:hypothetical protein
VGWIKPKNHLTLLSLSGTLEPGPNERYGACRIRDVDPKAALIKEEPTKVSGESLEEKIKRGKAGIFGETTQHGGATEAVGHGSPRECMAPQDGAIRKSEERFATSLGFDNWLWCCHGDL